MGCVITVHHPNLSKEDREYRVEQIKKRIIEYMQEVKAAENKANKNDYLEDKGDGENATA